VTTPLQSKDVRGSEDNVLSSAAALLLSALIFLVLGALPWGVEGLLGGLSKLFTTAKSYVEIIITLILIFFTIFVIKRLFIKRRNICINVYTSVFANREQIIDEGMRLGSTFKTLSKHGTIVYDLSRDRNRVQMSLKEVYLENLQHLVNSYGRGLLVLNAEECMTKNTCKLIYFDNINSVLNMCKSKIVILFKRYNIKIKDNSSYIIDVSEIIDINSKFRKIAELIGQYRDTAGRECIVLVDPIEYTPSELEKQVSRLMSLLGKPRQAKYQCIIAINAIEKDIYPSARHR